MAIEIKRLLAALNSSTITGEAARKLGCTDTTVRSSCLQHGIGSPAHHLSGRDTYVPWPRLERTFEKQWDRVFGNHHPGYQDRDPDEDTIPGPYITRSIMYDRPSVNMRSVWV